MHDESRRKLMRQGSYILAGGALSGLGLRIEAAEHPQHPMKKDVAAFVADAGEEGVCATCRFWGGMRKVSKDRKLVYCETLGWCNNPDSHHYHTVTTPETGPMKSWRKWEAL